MYFSYGVNYLFNFPTAFTSLLSVISPYASSLSFPRSFAFQGTNAHAVLGLAKETPSSPGSFADAMELKRCWPLPEVSPILAGGRVTVAGSRLVVAARLVGSGWMAHLADHKVAGRAVVPAAWHMELASAASVTLMEEGSPASLGNIAFRTMTSQPPVGSSSELGFVVDLRSSDWTISSPLLQPQGEGRGGICVSGIFVSDVLVGGAAAASSKSEGAVKARPLALASVLGNPHPGFSNALPPSSVDGAFQLEHSLSLFSTAHTKRE